MPNQVTIQVGAKNNTTADIAELQRKLNELKAFRGTANLDVNTLAGRVAVDKLDLQILSLQHRIDAAGKKGIGDLGAGKALIGIEAVTLALKRLDDQASKGFFSRLGGALTGHGPQAGSPGLLGRIGNLVPGLAGTGGGASGFGALASAGSSMWTNPYVIGGGAAAGAASAPFLGQLLGGAIVTGFGSLLAGMGIAGALGPKGGLTNPQQTQAAQLKLTAAIDNLAKLQASAKTTPAQLATAQASVLAAQGRLNTLQDSAPTAGQLKAQAAFKNLSDDAQNSLAQIGRSFVPVMESIFNTADRVLKKMTPIFAAADKAISGPFKVFSNTLISAFGTPAVQQSIAAVATAFGKILTAATPALAGGVGKVAQGITEIANNISRMNPNVITHFVNALFDVVAALLDTLAWLVKVGTYIETHFGPAMHRTAVIFDGVRHDIAHIWDQIFENSVGMIIRLGHNVETQFNSLRHSTANIFDGVRRDIANAWNSIWANTVSRVANGIGDVERYFRSLPGRIVALLGNALTVLAGWGSGVIHGLLNGITSALGSVGSFIASIPKKILGFLGFGSPPSWAIQAGKWIIEGMGIGMGQNVPNIGGGVARWAGVVRQALAMEGLPLSLTNQVLRQISSESGGNPNAINRTDINAQHGDPSRGLLQTIGSTFRAYHWPGTSFNIYDPLANIAAAINYARHVYGPSLMRGGMGLGSGHGYGTGGVAGGLIRVGEYGSELIRVPQGSRVWPHGSNQAAGSGGAASLHVEIVAGGQSAFEQFMLLALRNWVRIYGGGDPRRAFGDGRAA